MPALSPYREPERAEAVNSHKRSLEAIKQSSVTAREQAVRALQLYLKVLEASDVAEFQAIGADVQAIADADFAAVIADEVGCLDAVAAARGTTRQAILDAYAAHPGHSHVNTALQAIGAYVASVTE